MSAARLLLLSEVSKFAAASRQDVGRRASGLGVVDLLGVSRYFFHISWEIIFERMEAEVLLFQIELLKLIFSL